MAKFGEMQLVAASDVPLDALEALFDSLSSGAEAGYFRPHPMTRREAARVAAYEGLDFFAVVRCGASLVAYGMLRGWDEGYYVPSLGLAVSPAWRGRGVAGWSLSALHNEARRRGAKAVRLSVDASNSVAIRLYRRAGYELVPWTDGRLVGMLSLAEPI